LVTALIEIRGLKDTSARVEASRLMRFSKSDEAYDMLTKAIAGKDGITVRDLRSARVLTGDKAEENEEEVLQKKLTAVARYAIEKLGLDAWSDFVPYAKQGWQLAEKKAKAQHVAAAAGNGASDEDDDADATTEEDNDEE